MKRQAQLLVIVVLALLGLTAILLARLHSGQKLGKPGVKVVAQSVYDEHGKLVATNAVYLPERLLDYDSKELPVAQIELDWLPKDTTHGRRVYHAPDGFRAWIMAVLMGADRTSIHKPQQCLTGQGFRIDRQESLAIPINEPHRYSLPVLRITATREGTSPNGEKIQQRALYVYWFVADNRLTADHNERMWWMARDLIRSGVLQRWAYVSCLAYCLPGEEEATYARMQELIAMAVPRFQLTVGPALQLARNPDEASFR